MSTTPAETLDLVRGVGHKGRTPPPFIRSSAALQHAVEAYGKHGR